MSKERAGTLIVLTMTDKEQAASVIGAVIDAIPDDSLFRIVAHGEGSEELAAWAHRATSGAAHVGNTDKGYLEAVNVALHDAERWEHVVLLDQDVRLAGDWLAGLKRAITPEVVHVLGDKVVSDYGTVGIVAATSDQARHRAQRLDLTEGEASMGLSEYVGARASVFAGTVSAADVIEGFCVLLTPEAVDALLSSGGVLDCLLGTWAWADACLRADQAGLCTVVSEEVFVGRTTVVPRGSAEVGELNDRLRFYSKHPVPSTHRVIAVVRVALRWWRDLVMVKEALLSLSDRVDGVALLLLNHPDDMQSDKSDPLVEERFAERCHGATAEKAAKELKRWADRVVNCDVEALHCGGGDSRSQRRALLAMAEGMRADAVLILNHDEVIEDRVDRVALQRILAHPNPMVRSFDLEMVHHVDSEDLVRLDAPWGHGGGYQGAPHAARLLRSTSRRAGFAPAATRIASVRLRRRIALRRIDRARQGVTDNGEGMKMTRWEARNGIGLHMLLYRNEKAEDVARWLDDVHAVVDRVHLVWTDDWAEADKAWTLGDIPAMLSSDDWPETGPSRAFATVAHIHGAVWVHEPLDDNLAQARNAGISSLAEHSDTLRWAMFVDPDEWLGDPLGDASTLRSMATSTRWGFLMQVANYRPGAEVPTVSDSVRVSYLDPEGIMRMNGRVHEGFDQAIHALQARDIHPRLSYIPFILQHRGMAFSPERMSAKLDKYEDLLRLELGDHPHNPGAWVSLGWHYFNDGHTELGKECYQRALECSGNSYLPYKEMAYLHLRAARDLIGGCRERLTDAHQFHKLASHMGDWLNRYAPPHPVIARTETRAPLALPDWEAPARLGASRYDKK